MLEISNTSSNKNIRALLKSKTVFIKIDENINIFSIITTDDERLLEILDTFVKDAVLSVKTPSLEEASESLEFILSKINNFISKLKLPNERSLSISVCLVIGNNILFSLLGENNYIFVIDETKIEEEAKNIKGNFEFSNISSGKVLDSHLIIFSNVPIDEYIRYNDFQELRSIPSAKRQSSAIKNILAMCSCKLNTEVITISNNSNNNIKTNKKNKSSILNSTQNLGKNLIEKIYKLIKKLKINVFLLNIVDFLKKFLIRNPKIKSGIILFILIGLVFSLYVTINGILNEQISKTTTNESKELLLETRLMIEDAGKELGNEEIFQEMIINIESNIEDLSNRGIFQNDIDTINSELAALKKEFFDIESIDLSKREPFYKLPEGFETDNIIIFANKYYIIGKTSLIGPYIPGSIAPKSYTYPEGETVIGSDITKSGSIFLLTESSRVLTFNGDKIVYVNVEGQDAWQSSNGIKTFNDNIYLLNDLNNQIFTHRPGINGYSKKVERIQDTSGLNILDYGIDGGIYLLNSDLTFNKLITSPNYEKRGILLNKLPNNWNKNTDSKPKLFVKQDLKYVYLLLDGIIWIFEPDSSRFQDVRALTYIGQIEGLGLNNPIKAISTASDGRIYIANDVGMYEIDFDIVDGKISIR